MTPDIGLSRRAQARRALGSPYPSPFPREGELGKWENTCSEGSCGRR